MRSRTFARESALKVLYQKEMTGETAAAALKEFFSTQENFKAEARDFVVTIVEGVEKNVKQLDQTVEAVAENWNMSRMAVLDRNILRMAMYEMTQMTETPPKVVINEAVNLAKKYSGENSGKFVNGILDKLMRGIKTDPGSTSVQPPISQA